MPDPTDIQARAREIAAGLNTAYIMTHAVGFRWNDAHAVHYPTLSRALSRLAAPCDCMRNELYVALRSTPGDGVLLATADRTGKITYTDVGAAVMGLL